jgi:hypothetical protein
MSEATNPDDDRRGPRQEVVFVSHVPNELETHFREATVDLYAQCDRWVVTHPHARILSTKLRFDTFAGKTVYRLFVRYDEPCLSSEPESRAVLTEERVLSGVRAEEWFISRVLTYMKGSLKKVSGLLETLYRYLLKR